MFEVGGAVRHPLFETILTVVGDQRIQGHVNSPERLVVQRWPVFSNPAELYVRNQRTVADPSSRGDPRVIASWCLYDWANSAFNTLVVTFVYSVYFVQTFSDDPGRGTALWSRGITVSALIIAVLAPFAGALADQGNRRKYLVGCTLTCCLLTAGLAFVHPDQAHAAFIAMIVFVAANVAFEVGLVFYNSFLPNITSEERIGRVSGYGWGLGYAGGLVCLALALPFVTGDPPPLEMTSVDGFNVRATNLLVAAWFLAFSVPLFLFVRDADVRRSRPDIGAAFADLRQTFTHLRRHRQIMRFLVARLAYNDGLLTIFAFGGIYAAGDLRLHALGGHRLWHRAQRRRGGRSVALWICRRSAGWQDDHHDQLDLSRAVNAARDIRAGPLLVLGRRNRCWLLPGTQPVG